MERFGRTAVTMVLGLLVLFLSGCGANCVPIYSTQGVPLKVLVRENNTPLSSTAALDDQIGFAQQWQPYYVCEATDTSYSVVTALDTEQGEKPVYIAQSSVFEWPTHFTLNFATSPDQADREQVHVFVEREEAAQGEAAPFLIEKWSHDTVFHPSIDPMPVLSDTGVYNDVHILYIATLYDDYIDGKWVDLDHYDFGYMPFVEGAHEFRIYLNWYQLDRLVRNLNRSSAALDTMNLRPSDTEEVYRGFFYLIADFGEDFEAGWEELRRVLPLVPGPSAGVLQEQDLEPEVVGEQRRAIQAIQRELAAYLDNDQLWEEIGKSTPYFIPAPWMEETPATPAPPPAMEVPDTLP